MRTAVYCACTARVSEEHFGKTRPSLSVNFASPWCHTELLIGSDSSRTIAHETEAGEEEYEKLIFERAIACLFPSHSCVKMLLKCGVFRVSSIFRFSISE
ncbi:hypothetical protein R5R35_007784 [Gryllus longicercus]|uniref:Uncharacterized protein n=1 Tax=Gryllus longicercus TaxID=2509291 RepID=A0AAN9ZJ39_9ORTH